MTMMMTMIPTMEIKSETNPAVLDEFGFPDVKKRLDFVDKMQAMTPKGQLMKRRRKARPLKDAGLSSSGEKKKQKNRDIINCLQNFNKMV